METSGTLIEIGAAAIEAMATAESVLQNRSFKFGLLGSATSHRSPSNENLTRLGDQ
jgi:hypothetical protein